MHLQVLFILNQAGLCLRHADAETTSSEALRQVRLHVFLLVQRGRPQDCGFANLNAGRPRIPKGPHRSGINFINHFLNNFFPNQ